MIRRTQHDFKDMYDIPYLGHHNPLLIRNRSRILTIHKGRIFWKNLLEKTFLTFKKWVKNIQTTGYNILYVFSYVSILSLLWFATKRSFVILHTTTIFRLLSFNSTIKSWPFTKYYFNESQCWIVLQQIVIIWFAQILLILEDNFARQIFILCWKEVLVQKLS